MDKAEAYKILLEHLQTYRSQTYSDLVQKIKTQETPCVIGPTGVKYQLEFQFFWDAQSNGNLRVIGSIDDSGWYAFHPLSEDFIMAPDGSFLGES